MIIKLLITYQILVINLALTHIVAKKKYSTWITWSSLFLFTVVLSVVLSLSSSLFLSDRPTVWFVVTGSFYIVPLYILYHIKFRELITIMIYCWTYTMGLTAIAVGIGNFITIFSQNVSILLLQTLLFMVTLHVVLRFTTTKFMVILQSASDTTRDSLILIGVSMFGMITGTRYFISPNETIYYLFVFLIIIVAVTSYNLLFLHVESNISLDNIKKISYHDTLTGIANRYSLFQDVNQYISTKQEFTVLFLDLDGLKRVNDTLGHKIGDDYLKHFANTLLNLTKNNGRSYRFAGDEFVCIFSHQTNDIDVNGFEQHINVKMSERFHFGGVSIGVSEYPKDGLDADTLLQVADKRMYGAKNSKKIRTPQAPRT